RRCQRGGFHHGLHQRVEPVERVVVGNVLEGLAGHDERQGQAGGVGHEKAPVCAGASVGRAARTGINAAQRPSPVSAFDRSSLCPCGRKWRLSRMMDYTAAAARRCVTMKATTKQALISSTMVGAGALSRKKLR